MSTVTVGVEDFGAGIYRGRESPPNAAYDLLNLLLDDEGQPFRRGGSAFKSNANAGTTLRHVFDLLLLGGQRTIFGSGTATYLLSADDATPTALPGAAIGLLEGARAASTAGVAIFRASASSGNDLVLYAGSRKPTYTTGTLNLTNGSRTVTGAGTAFLANVDKGMFIMLGGNNFTGGTRTIVESVQSDTSLTLREPFTAGSNPALATHIVPYRLPFWASSVAGTLKSMPKSAIAGVAGRVVFCIGNQAFFMDATNVPGVGMFRVEEENYHELPASLEIIGAEGVGNTLVLFTTSGVWAISNMEFDPIDDVGNIQHVQQELNEIVLWGDPGVARWRGAVVVPAVDDVWLMSLDGTPIPVGGGIKPLYLEYVKAGYQPGLAATHRGHYILPILNGTSLVDVLVCRLDRPYGIGRSGQGWPWMRWSGHGASIAYAQRIGATTRSPKLLGLAGQRVTEVTDAWNPTASNASEADGTTHAIDLVTRDLPTPGGRRGSTTRKLRVRYEAAAAATPTITAAFATGLESASFTALSLARDDGGGASDGKDESTWRVGKQAVSIRFRLQSSSALSSFKLRGLAAEYTPRGA